MQRRAAENVRTNHQYQVNKSKSFLQHYERYYIPLAVVLGFHWAHCISCHNFNLPLEGCSTLTDNRAASYTQQDTHHPPLLRSFYFFSSQCMRMLWHFYGETKNNNNNYYFICIIQEVLRNLVKRYVAAMIRDAKTEEGLTEDNFKVGFDLTSKNQPRTVHVKLNYFIMELWLWQMEFSQHFREGKMYAVLESFLFILLFICLHRLLDHIQ